MVNVGLVAGMFLLAAVNARADGNPCGCALARNGRPIRVAVIGGSITAGAGASSVEKRWPNRFVSFLQEKFPETRFELVNAGIGATGSEIGACRVKRDVLGKAPDLVIVEFSVNDTSTRESAESYEGLIRQLLAADRKIDVMCLGMVDQRGVSAQAWHEQVARHYGLPFVSYRDEVWPKIQKGELRWTDVAADSVHPNDMGHDLAARLLFRAYDKSSKVRETLPPPLFGTTLAHGDFVKMTDLEPLENNGFFPLKDSMWGIGLACTNANGRLLVRAKGRAVAILYRKGCAPYNWGKIAVSLDGGEPRVIDCFSDQWWWYTPDVFLCRDAPGEHLIEIRTLPEKNPKSRGYGCHLTGILVCEAEGLH